MKTLQVIFGMLALLIVGAQTFRHIYVLWIEPRGSVLDQFDSTGKDIAESKSLDELVALYEAAWQKVKEADAAHASDTSSESYFRRREQEPYTSAEKLRQAIEEWESHKRQLCELHFFWWAGFLTVILGVLAYYRATQWLGISGLLLGYLEMIWATSPSFSSLGYPIEFERLLTYKVIYSAVTLGLVLIAWFGFSRRSRQEFPN
jgi:hypothetical protein